MKRILSIASFSLLAGLVLGSCQRAEEITGTADGDGLFLSRYALTIDKGETETVLATVTPKDAWPVSWTSADPEVATVDSKGLVTAVGAGETVLTAKAGSLSRTCEVNVLSAVKEVSLDQTSVEMSKSQSVQLTATIGPDDINVPYTVEWTSSDPSVASVDDTGLVTALKGGETVITVKAGDVSATCAVQVVLKAVGIEVTPASASMQVNKTLQLTASLIPSDATDTFSFVWSSSNPAVASVDENGMVSTHAEGEAVITVKAGSFEAASTISVAGGYLVTKAANMANNYFEVTPWYNNNSLSSLDAVTVEVLFRADRWINPEADQVVNSIFGIEGYWLVRVGDVGIGENTIQLATNHGNATTTIKPTAGEWHHLAVVYDTASKDALFYLDGELAYTASGFASRPADLSKVCDHDHVGCAIGNSYESNRYFNGAFAEMRVWKTVRTAEQIRRNMYVCPPSSDMLAYWKFNEGEGNEVKDHSGNGLHLTAHTSLVWEDVQLPQTN